MLKIDNKKIKKLRVQTGYNQKDFAKILDLSQMYYNGIEIGRNGCSPTILKRIGDTLGVDLWTLYQDEKG